MTKSYNQILRRVGIVWIVFGLVDIIYFIGHTTNGYIASHISVSPAWGTIAVALGVLLIRGNLRVANWMGGIAIFFALWLCGSFLVAVLFRPLGLWMVELRQAPTNFVARCLFNIATLAVLGWTHQQLRSRTVLEACAAKGLETKLQKIGFAVVFGLISVVALLTHSMLNGSDAAEAEGLRVFSLAIATPTM
ncbi:hypothetical protein [Leptolyngbya sp. FACHB-8]|uniref:hypothetical protein n=1 Tax=unclassified Leptolyngbya TaxID=2650499 RepID=UPI001682F355|nr:hypothetical protein [Leptolyngbya sp. FACHB-8]MBD1914052.1 hypothetical protein [Leptolyngbya sp. FACHB-8]